MFVLKKKIVLLVSDFVVVCYLRLVGRIDAIDVHADLI